MDNLEQVIFYRLERAIRAYRQFAQREIRNAGFAITVDQWLTIKNILENPGIKQQELAEKVFKDNASITRIIDLLVKAKYLKRKVHAQDRRRTELTVTKTGEEIIAKVSSVIAANRATALRRVGPDELAAIEQALAKITDNCLK